jgi:DNA-binding transcriptional regulator YiaG
MDTKQTGQVNEALPTPPKTYQGAARERKGKSFDVSVLTDLRGALDVGVDDFSRLIGIDFNSIYKWESAREGTVEIPHSPARIVTLLLQLCERLPDLRWADDVRQSIAKRGGTFGLHRLLVHYFRSLGLDKSVDT